MHARRHSDTLPPQDLASDPEDGVAPLFAQAKTCRDSSTELRSGSARKGKGRALWLESRLVGLWHRLYFELRVSFALLGTPGACVSIFRSTRQFSNATFEKPEGV